MKKNGKNIFLMLLILTVVGIVGYGVYSYYYASGSVTHTGTIEIDGFDVRLYNSTGISDDNANPIFLKSGLESVLECEHDSGELFVCSGGAGVHNNGTKDVVVEISNLEATISGSDSASVVSVSTDWNDDSIIVNANSSDGYTITVEVEIPGYQEPSDEAISLTSPIEGGELEVVATYDVLATEVHD